ncbi:MULTISPECIES: adenylosuccinate lyase [Providencia]|uniref:adenylosuccinate lyase n=1 Tax=Providencia TaxID=586 RepID=UPI001981F99F|nr:MULTISPECIES: adenylosuccinate lyase [Providencia]MBN4864416.1 adenylosuccinate lyase [Providencia stuartii]MBN4874137.1 adenylosuccinate lyase [Providencia stuartii]MBN4878828.1 adenylosuccinate lyase [Providencia stuartii]MBN4882939.1 adenylosuccinate lyase [Providencia stuartii]HEM8292882.1 adenylosuccinate lyase [Providencia stuartii]
MASHLIDFILIGNNFGTEEMRHVWSEHNRLKSQVAVEVALAKAEGELGLIPTEAAQYIEQHADADKLNIEEIASQGAQMKHSLMPTLIALQKQCGEAGEYIHYGATTQDIVDTATMLQLKSAFNIIERDAKALVTALANSAKRYQNTPMVGRTHGMQALPTTFGFKVAVWLDEFLRHHQRLNEIKSRVLTGNISGAICTYAAFGETGPAVEKRTLDILGLSTPTIGWQSARDRFSEFASVCALISGTLGKIGNELYNLMRTEINEIEEPFSAGKIGSTTMPHKRNPAALEGLASLTHPLLKSVSLIYESMHVEHERDAMSWRAEWIALPEICIYLSAQLKNALAVIEGVTVNEKQMRRNLDLQGGLLLSEKVMFELGTKIGKQTAHHIVYECAMQAYEEQRTFKDVLQANEQLAGFISEQELDAWLDPINYLGSAPQKVDQVIAHAKTLGLLAD